MIRKKNGSIVSGRIMDEKDGKLHLATNLLEPETLTVVARSEIDAMRPSKVSPMPEKLVNTLNRNELLDLMAYLLSAGDPKHRAFR